MAESPHMAVRCRELTKTYGSGQAAVSALRGVDLDVRRGEMLMLVGPSGCGKTSLISIIATLSDQNSGGCEVLGRDVRQMDEPARAQFRNQAIGFVFQVFNLLPALSVVENIALPMLIAGAGRRRAESRAAELADSVGLGDRRGALPRELSGGQQQRVAIARALVRQPELLLCDEPTSSLDHDTGQMIMELLMKEAKAPDRAVIVVTHDPRIFGFADRIARMDDGRIVAQEQADG